MGVKMFNYIFLFVWLAYGLFEFIATKKIGMLACYQFFIAD